MQSIVPYHLGAQWLVGGTSIDMLAKCHSVNMENVNIIALRIGRDFVRGHVIVQRLLNYGRLL